MDREPRKEIISQHSRSAAARLARYPERQIRQPISNVCSPEFQRVDTCAEHEYPAMGKLSTDILSTSCIPTETAPNAFDMFSFRFEENAAISSAGCRSASLSSLEPHRAGENRACQSLPSAAFSALFTDCRETNQNTDSSRSFKTQSELVLPQDMSLSQSFDAFLAAGNAVVKQKQTQTSSVQTLGSSEPIRSGERESLLDCSKMLLQQGSWPENYFPLQSGVVPVTDGTLASTSSELASLIASCAEEYANQDHLQAGVHRDQGAIFKRRLKIDTGEASVCQIWDCRADLSDEKPYCRRYKLCRRCMNRPSVSVEGIEMRFCQQCSYLHPLSHFDGKKRSCREKLQKHALRVRRSRAAAAARSLGAHQPENPQQEELLRNVAAAETPPVSGGEPTKGTARKKKC
eukprot:CAMPEP_0177603752 /NCGR_PEP_ID=MMETSP0419_2-20121207/15702_1 /TAXON_ID=582737 /ORGANISM="Tetraselmis sp., Strain GSL018" /LENGTH=403 /DNA_ID=CAMNT_0019097589 /DNA_START=143 /DNA_END=1354 /DNA_ORIENTATION=-